MDKIIKMSLLLLFIGVLFTGGAKDPSNNSSDETISIDGGVLNTPTLFELQRFPLVDVTVRSLVYDGNTLWMGDGYDLYQINITDGTLISQDYNSSRSYDALTWDGASFWTVDNTRDIVIQFDKTTMAEIKTYPHFWNNAMNLAYGNGILYIHDSNSFKIYLMDTTDGSEIGNYDQTDNIKDLFFENDQIWYAKGNDKIKVFYAVNGIESNYFVSEIYNIYGYISSMIIYG